MTVFATSVLDDFNRANESPLSAAAGWVASQWQSTVSFSNGPLSVVSNKMAPFESGVGDVYQSGQVRSDVIAADVECYVTLPVTFAGGSQIFLMARADAPGVALGAGRAYIIGFLINNAGSFNAFQVMAGTQANTSARFLGNPSGGVVAGGKLGVRVFGSNPVFIELWAFAGGVWVLQSRLTDSDPARITAAGRIGIYCFVNTNQASGQPLDDFGGGAIIAPTYSINTDVFPTFTGGLRDRIAEKGWVRPGMVPVGTGNVAGHGGNLVVF